MLCVVYLSVRRAVEVHRTVAPGQLAPLSLCMITLSDPIRLGAPLLGARELRVPAPNQRSVDLPRHLYQLLISVDWYPLVPLNQNKT